MLWVYGQYKYFYSYSAGIDFSCQNLTSTFWRQILTTNVDPRALRVKTWIYHCHLHPLQAAKEIQYIFIDLKLYFNASWGPKGLNLKSYMLSPPYIYESKSKVGGGGWRVRTHISALYDCSRFWWSKKKYTIVVILWIICKCTLFSSWGITVLWDFLMDTGGGENLFLFWEWA